MATIFSKRSGWGPVGGVTLSQTSAEKYDGTYSCKAVTTATNTNEGLDLTTKVSGLTPSVNYTASAYVKAPVGVQMVLNLWEYTAADAIVQSKSVPFTGTGDWQRVSASLLFGATGVKARMWVATAVKTATTFYVDAVLLEQTAALTTYFPTAAQLVSGEAGWSGTAHASASDIGPFARGTTRVFTGLLKLDTAKTHVFFSDSSAAGVYSYINAAGSLVFTMDGEATTASWSGVFATGQTYFFALIFGSVTAQLYINGSKVIGGDETFSRNLAAAGVLQLTATSNPLDGSLLPFAGFLKALDASTLRDYTDGRVSQPYISQIITAPPLRESWKITTPSGKVYRWAEDEPKAENVPLDVTYSSSMPGGYKDCSVTLPRQPEHDYPDLERGSTLEVFTCGQKVGEYRVDRVPRASEDQMAVTVQGTGWISHLEDDKSAAEIFVDRDLSGWQQQSTTRRLGNVGAGVTIYDPDIGAPDATSGLPSIITKVGPGGGAINPFSEALYDAGPNTLIAKIYFELQASGKINVADGNWNWMVFSCDDDSIAGVFNETGDLQPSGATFAKLQTLLAPKRCLLIQQNYAVAIASTDLNEYAISWRNIAVCGNHGLTLYGTSPAYGVLASDVIPYALSKWAPLLKYTTGSTGSIRPTSYIIPQLAFKDRCTAGDMLRGADRYELSDYAVWDDKTFYYAARGTFARQWRARVREAQLQETGPSMDRVWNGILVRYCVDPETECLTKRGWQTYDALREDDELLAFNPETKTTRWECPREIFVDDRYKGDMIHLDGVQGQLGALTTPDHRWPIYNRPRHGKPPFVKVATSETLPNDGYIIRNAPYNDAPTAKTYSDEIVRLVAWYITEGSLGVDGKRISICQSQSANPQKVAAIRADLEAVTRRSISHHPGPRPLQPNARLRGARCRAGLSLRTLAGRIGSTHTTIRRYETGENAPTAMRRRIANVLGVRPESLWNHPERAYSPRWEGMRFGEYCDSRGLVAFKVSGEGVDEIIDAAPGRDKVPTMEFLLALTREQLEMFLDVCIAADGYAKKRIFYQYHPERMDAYTVAAVLAGRCPTLHADGAACSLNENRMGTSLNRLKRERVDYEGTIWCPVTESGHWVARRRGKVFITGNTDVDGTTRIVGPTGSDCATTSDSLLDTDPLNPANQLGIRKWDMLDMQGVALAADAVRVGTRFLEESKALDGSGQATITGYVMDAGGRIFPHTHMRAGDEISFVDASDTSYRRIVNVQHQRSTRSSQIDLDAPPDSLEQLLARLNVALVRIGLGS